MQSVDRKNELLKKLQSKEIDMRQFLYECAIWGMDSPCWVEYDIRPEPVSPPEWNEYVALPLAKRAKVSEEFFHTLPIKEYLQKRSDVIAANHATLSWLKDMRKVINDMGKEEDGIYLRKLDDKIAEFEYKDPMVDKVKHAFTGKVYGGTYD